MEPQAKQNPTKPVAVGSPPHLTWRSRLARWALGLKPADDILRRRAAGLIDKLHVSEHLKQGGVYLDIGSGTGHNTVRMAGVARGLHARFVCVEPMGGPTRRVLRRTETRTDGLIQFVGAVGNRLPLADHSADGASVFFVLHHIPYDIQLQVLGEIKRVLKPGGLIFVWEDTPENEQEYKANEVWDRRLNFEARNEAHYYRSRGDWLGLFRQEGIDLVEQAYFEDHSRWRNEGLIRHTGFVLRHGQKG